MKRAAVIISAVTAALSLSVANAEESKMSLADARAKISEVINSPSEMTSIVKQLSAADQVAYLNEVNGAIEEMPGSVEEKTAKYLNVNRAAYKGAEKGNMSKLVAETYATVPAESLAILSERYAADIFNRAADPSITFTDEQYKSIVTNVMRTINSRLATANTPNVRSAFAGLMFIRASNGTPSDIVDFVTEQLLFDAQNFAREEWYPDALAEGDKQSCERMMEAAQAGQIPSSPLVLSISGPQVLDALLPNIVEWAPIVVATTGYEFNGMPAKDAAAGGGPAVPAAYRGPVESGPYDGQTYP